MNRNILIIVIIVLGLLGLILGLIILNLTEKKIVQIPTDIPITLKDVPFLKKPPTAPPQQTKPQTLTGLEVAQKMALFLDKSQKADGTFQLFYTCDKKLSPLCLKTEKGSATPHSGMITLAYLELYQKTQNEIYKNRADQAMEVTLTNCQQNKDFCEWNFFPLFIWYQDSKDQKYLNAMLSVSDRFMADQPLIKQVNENYGIKLEMLYKATADKKYLTKLIQMTDALLAGGLDQHEKNLEIYREGGISVRALSQNIIWNNLLPTYRATSDNKYLKAVQDFYEKAQILKHFDDYKNREDFFPLMLAMDNLLTLSGLAVSPAIYLTQAREIAQTAILTLWDTPQNRRFDGDFGWLKYFRDTDNEKSTLHAGWLIRMFVKMEKQSFTL